MLITAKLNLMSGIAIGATAMIVMRQICMGKLCRKPKKTDPTAALSNK